ncbi:alpha-amylase [bacterium (Candidatus Blackallbacteria) CG17_big_fil_post_rev_8_21_14_2_50_48_46]|uniref:Alpha-amylase n=1 Tax=bacterium (Candidatus Blackallbacteria) CG17_big_fil_post_rev_8_21_14_2_50_48_46 TaxID=2014261 RepID=A0A2M7GA71_9BACT|nr:MAG: alpha-amylase [bacterium (Candidatus Blackallbacteria) CG18_big_fil_WC_8_21_14_2_50_49_26]PIW19036.1 MAG: alpha-amylase [bacterium (Candidatus Blackallbacteria) CG17_big_fil_post_rev_8_21_14_2_50_48_46]PIW44597.1 MAG: alpha-amylase [bacterium (Candidatus Blackallbacteria) CG13_big_fil_rev_8_21_14_2_50_49_14]
MKQLRSLLTTALLSSLALTACSSLSNTLLPVGTQTAGRVQAQAASSAQTNLSAYSIGAAKNLIAARKQSPAPALAARNLSANFATPEWVKDAVFYQIFPERFANGNTRNDPPGTEPWGSKPKLYNFMGGDLEGVIQKLPYLKELGINAIYFNPIFEAPNSNHKYNTADYMKLDPAFGDMNTFKTLIAKAHSMGIKVVLDAVFNHSGDAHWAFQDVIKNGPKSKYWNWYLVHGFPVVQEPKPNYESWWGFASLPKWNEYNPEVREYLFKAAEYWTQQGIDGWRLDVPNEVRDMNFWREFRTRVKRMNPELYIVGEIWGDGSPWLQGDQFDAVMNYQFRETVFDFLINDKTSVDQLDWGLEGLRKRHPDSVTYSMFNVLGSHDTARILSMAKGDINKVKLAALFQMSYVGAPVIYYGDEIGLAGEMDPDCRRTMPWEPSQWNQDLRTYYKRLIQIRNQYPVLRRGSFRSLMRHNDNRTFAYLREDAKSKIMVVINNNLKAQDIPLDLTRVNVPDGNLRDLISGRTLQIRNGQLLAPQVPAKTGLLLEWSPAR